MKRLLLTAFGRMAVVVMMFLLMPGMARAAIVINEENFPDENFRAYLLSQPYGEDGELTSLEIRGVKNMYLYKMDIKSLEGINVFTELITLSCYDNQLTELDVSELTALQELRCHNNQLTKLNVSGCTALTLLSCSNNQLTKLDVSKCKMLQQLTCQNNQLTTLDVRRCLQLFNFYCAYNKLTELKVSGCKALEWLSCSNNQLTELDLSGCTSLSSLLCQYNQLSALNVSSCTVLWYLYCYQNRIRGEAMDALIASLPIRNEDVRFYVYEYDNGDKNICTYDQVAAALERGWTTYCRIDNEFWEYEGADPESVETVRLTPFLMRGAIYDLQGRRLNKAPKKGLYIENGKKTIIR